MSTRDCIGSADSSFEDAISAGLTVSPHDARLAFTHDSEFHRMQRVHESNDVPDIDPIIPAGWQRTASQEVYIGVLAADEQNSFSRLDAGVNLRRKHIADEGIAQGDQMHIRRK